jgi:ribosomal protein S6
LHLTLQNIAALHSDYNTLTALMKEISLKIVINGGIVRSIQNHGIRQLPHRFKSKYADREGNRYYEKGRFISVFYDANPNVMRQVQGILNLDDQILRTTHLRASNKFGEVNNLRENKNPYIQDILEELRLEGSSRK